MSLREANLIETKRLFDYGGYVETLSRAEPVFVPEKETSFYFFPDQIASVAPAPDSPFFKAIVPDSGHDDDGGLAPVLDPILGIDDTDLFPIYGTNGADVINGTDGGNIIDAMGGNDEVYGAGGHDNIDLGSGDDYAQGQAGNDWIKGGDGNDAILGDFGNASFLDGNDFLDGGAGNDILYGGGGDDHMFGGSGTDFLSGEGGNDFMVGSSGGTDEMYGGAGADTFVSVDNSQQHNVWDYSAAEGDQVEGDAWSYNAGTNITTVQLNGANLFLLHDYNANVGGINLIEWNPEPAA